jgi:ribonuclease E
VAEAVHHVHVETVATETVHEVAAPVAEVVTHAPVQEPVAAPVEPVTAAVSELAVPELAVPELAVPEVADPAPVAAPATEAVAPAPAAVAAPAPVAAAPAPVAAPKPVAAPVDLGAVLASAGLTQAKTDPAKHRAAQEAAAAVVVAPRVPRERKPLAPQSNEPLVQVHTRTQ